MVTFPTDIEFVKGIPKLKRSSSVSSAGKRQISVVEYEDPYWMIDVETQPLEDFAVGELRAFINYFNNGARSFIFTPNYLPVPSFYIGDENNAALSNDGNLLTITDGYTIAVSSVTNGLVLRPGDFISMTYGAYRSLHTVIVGATASGGNINLVVEPAIPSYIVAGGSGAVVKFINLELNVRMIPDSDDITDDYPSVATFQLREIPK